MDLRLNRLSVRDYSLLDASMIIVFFKLTFLVNERDIYYLVRELTEQDSLIVIIRSILSCFGLQKNK